MAAAASPDSAARYPKGVAVSDSVLFRIAVSYVFGGGCGGWGCTVGSSSGRGGLYSGAVSFSRNPPSLPDGIAFGRVRVGGVYGG